MDIDRLIARFGDAGLDLEAARAPIARGAQAEDVFQMDVRRRNPKDVRSEYYMVWPGHTDNLVVVQGLDRAEQQLVLMVREPAREFFENVPFLMFKREGREGIAQRAGVKLEDVVLFRGDAFVRRRSDARKRHFLVGRDERQLFMCRLPRACTTVREAHQALRVPQASESRSAIDRPIRQGEWFFVVPDPAELVDLPRAIVRRKVSIGMFILRAGKPHVVDELVVLKGGVYVRGAVRHVDHKTIHLRDWRRVFRNNEVDEGRSLFGGSWID